MLKKIKYFLDKDFSSEHIKNLDEYMDTLKSEKVRFGAMQEEQRIKFWD